MKRLQLDQDIKPMSEFRSNTASFLRQVRETRRPMVITQHGKAQAVLVDVTEFEAMRSRLELLENVYLAEAQIDNGEGISHKNAKNQVLRRIKK